MFSRKSVIIYYQREGMLPILESNYWTRRFVSVCVRIGSGESRAQFSTNMARNKTHFVPTNNEQKRMKIISYDVTKSGNQK